MQTPAFIDQWQRDRVAGLRRSARRRVRERQVAVARPEAVRASGPGGDVLLTSDGVIRLDEELARL